MKRARKFNTIKRNNNVKLHKELPIFVYAKIFGDTFIVLTLSLSLSICFIGRIGIQNIIYYLQHYTNDISVISYFIIITLAVIVTLYAITAWICILNKRKYVKVGYEEIIYKGILRTKVIRVEKVEYVHFEYTDNGVFKANRVGMLIKCDNNLNKNSSNNLFVNYTEFPKEEMINAINKVIKF